MDFEKEKPAVTDGFTVEILPTMFSVVLGNINAYARANPEEDITSASQVAIWLSQDIPITEIASVFQLTPFDENLVRRLAG